MTRPARSPTFVPVDRRELAEMPKTSRETATVEDFGVAEDRHEDLDGYTVNFVTTREAADLAPMLKGLPDDRCQCPHWGYVFEGRLTFTFADREEVYEAGDAFFTPSGHTPRADAGSAWVQFSPTHELETTQAAMALNMQAMHG
jgi:mannose-6-phosphate isomerase-like protein (cupin superfamily)